jgi:hypothetical protein
MGTPAVGGVEQLHILQTAQAGVAVQRQRMAALRARGIHPAAGVVENHHPGAFQNQFFFPRVAHPADLVDLVIMLQQQPRQFFHPPFLPPVGRVHRVDVQAAIGWW